MNRLIVTHWGWWMLIGSVIWQASASGQEEPEVNTRESGSGEVSAVLGTETIVFEPSDFWIDGPYFTYEWKSQIYGVLPSDRTHRTKDFVASRIETIEPMEGLAPGPEGSWDELGSWLNGVYRDHDDVLHGFYHGESRFQPISKARNRASVGYAFSRDGGKSWIKPGHPDNRVITGQNGSPYAGDGHLTIMPDALRFYFCQLDGQYAAESSFTGHGRPGTWKSYQRGEKGGGSFSVDALRGNGSKLEGLSYAAFVGYNKYLSKYLAVDGSVNSDGESHRSFNLKVSDDGVAWEPLLEEELSLPQTYAVLTLYPSLVGLDGGSATGRSFWLYYVYVSNPNVLARVKVTLSKQSSKG